MRCLRPVPKIWRDEYGRVFAEGEAGDLNSSTSVEAHLLFAVLTELRKRPPAPVPAPVPDEVMIAESAPGGLKRFLQKLGVGVP